jgi:hypothetical protein
MTKAIRIENADTSDHKVMIEVWDKLEGNPDVLVEKFRLDCPTQMIEKTIWSRRYLVIRED